MNTNNFLKTRDGLYLLRHITAEYGTWNEAKQCYDLPVTVAISLAEEALAEEYGTWNEAKQCYVL